MEFKSWIISEEDKVKMLLDGQNILFFFLKDNIPYGGPEESRLIFAKIKNPAEDKKWAKEASFIAINLADALQGKKTQAIFSQKDIKNIKIISRENVEEILAKKLATNPLKAKKEEEPGFIKLKDIRK